jgi:CDP-glycerol glycerophosphotransferase
MWQANSYSVGKLKNNISLTKAIWRKVPIKSRNNIRALIGARTFNVARNMAIGTKATNHGLVSVVIPVFNVERYLDKCLASIVNQTYGNLEIIVVDDGSTDGSADIIRSYSRKDRRIKVYTIENSGNGVARNIGIAKARGKFLTFADSDDIVPRDAYAVMLKQLSDSNSDFVCGSYQRIHGTKRWTPQSAKDVHGVDRIGINLDQFPEAIHDIFLWNKIFRMSYWQESVGAIPEGILYEDQETLIRAYIRSASFDIISKVVYTWRLRDDSSSITQQKADHRDLRDRMTVSAEVSALVELEASEIVKATWYAKLLGPDFRLYIEQIPKTDDLYWETLHGEINRIVGNAGTDAAKDLSLRDRVLLSLVIEGRRVDITKVLVHGQEHGWSYPTERNSDGLVARPQYLDLLSAPIKPGLLRLQSNDLRLNAKLYSFVWSSPTVLIVEGHAYIENMDISLNDNEISINLVNRVSGERLAFDVEKESYLEIDQKSGDRWNSYSNGKFLATLDVSPLFPDLESFPSRSVEWDVQITTRCGEVELTGNFGGRDKERMGPAFELGDVVDKNRVVALFDSNDGLRLRVVTYEYEVSDVRLNGRRATFVLAGVSQADVPSVSLHDGDRSVIRSTHAIGTAEGTEYSIDIPELPASSRPSFERIWTVKAETKAGKQILVGWTNSSVRLRASSSGTSIIRFGHTGYGYLQVRDRRWHIAINDIEVDDTAGSLSISGQISRTSIQDVDGRLPKLCLATGKEAIWPSQIEYNQASGAFHLKFELRTPRWGRGMVSVNTDAYSLRCMDSEEALVRGAYWVPVAADMPLPLPHSHLLSQTRITVTATEQARALVIKFGPPFSDDERGNFNQQKIRNQYASMTPTLRNAALFESFGGKSATDSVRAIHDEVKRRGSDIQTYWSIKDYSVDVPDGSEPVLMYSKKWYELLNSARILVNNNNFPHFFRKTVGQHYIQTWHGTPLKRIGNDAPKNHLSLSYQLTMKRESEYWDVLLAQSPFAASLLAPAFEFEGRTEVLGYPRNDSLLSAGTDTRRLTTRSLLGVADDVKAVLYAPTWRDNVRTASRQYDLVTYLDFQKIRKAFGDDVVILLRGHHNIAGQRSTIGDNSFIDVTAYPEINDLYLAADVLITDYSSVMFDFAVTGKPMIFLTPDIELYRDKTRGFYFDLEAVAPGPVVQSTEEVIEILGSSKLLEATVSERYRSFVTKFAPLDDGNVACAVVDAVWPF